MSGALDWNAGTIEEFRANQGKVGGQMAGMPLMLLTTTGAKTGRALTKPLAYTKDGEPSDAEKSARFWHSDLSFMPRPALA